MSHDAPPGASDRSLLRLATAADLPAIAALDAACFGNSWSRDVYAQELARPFARLRLCEQDGVVLGLSCAWIVADEAHLLRIATLARARRHGHGRALLSAVIDEATAAGCQHVLLEVAAGNVAAVSLYRSFGFEPIGRRKAYYVSPPDDALVMRRALEPAASGR